MKTTFWGLLIFVGFSSYGAFEHDATDPQSGSQSEKRSSAEQKPQQKKKSMTSYIDKCRADVDGGAQYETDTGLWEKAEAVVVAGKESAFLNADEDRVEYKKGDVLLRVRGRGWYKSRPCEIPPPDSRCRYPKNLDTKNLKAVLKNNKECAIENEVLRFTVAKRLGIPAAYRNSPGFKERIESEMKRLWNPDWSYITRHRATVMSAYGAGSGYEHWNYQNTPSIFANTFKESKYQMSSPSENAWGNAFQGSTVDQIAFNLAENGLTGWNYHAGHAQNMMSGCDNIGIGVHLDDNGAVTAYSQFSYKIPR